MEKKFKKQKKTKKIKKDSEPSIDKKLNDAFDLFHGFTKKYKGQNIGKVIEGENLTQRETACFMLGFSLAEEGKKNDKR